MRMQGYCDVYKWTFLKRTSPEVKCLHLTSSRHEMCTLSVSNVIYHKFSHRAAFYTLNGKNVNIMLESTLVKFTPCCKLSFRSTRNMISMKLKVNLCKIELLLYVTILLSFCNYPEKNSASIKLP